jgi:hypothetical protein
MGIYAIRVEKIRIAPVRRSRDKEKPVHNQSGGAEVPEGGVASTVTEGQLHGNLDPKPEPKKKVSVVVPRVFERRG